ncbi:helix-turn-helix transcriptional regulator [Pedobacter sp. MC2016-05]|uniref:helix-turn-helix transcriptional regulator n=1 Tax=Pedobacter sp. MC2016-05 TaxID=2994474 RepID=UPI002245F0ED|nr:helix-turn-helix transcriptional regulator [Pedobacter sp. MC2016-05]MCX2475496.1 helix-turn-helix transcriptional regulator [Pedobacter sp. MC2016-05]
MENNNIAIPKIMGLDEQEIKALELIAEGLTYSEISQKLNLNENKIDSIRKNLMVKTKTKNSASLVSFAYKYGLLKV